MSRDSWVVLALGLAACQSSPPVATVSLPAPQACQLAAFGTAPGMQLPSVAAAKPASRNKSEPLKSADKTVVNRSAADTGKWTDAAPGWKAWRYYLRSETARAVSVHVEPLALPAGAEFWLCSPDRTTRKGPITGRGPGNAGRYWSAEVAGPELWLEVLTPAGTEEVVSFVIAEAFAAPL